MSEERREALAVEKRKGLAEDAIERDEHMRRGDTSTPRERERERERERDSLAAALIRAHATDAVATKLVNPEHTPPPPTSLAHLKPELKQHTAHGSWRVEKWPGNNG